MTHEERNNLVAIFTNLTVVGYFAWRLWQMNLEGEFNGTDHLVIWAQTVLWMIPASIVATIVLTILFNIVYSIATRNPKPSFVVDERDKLLGIRGMVVTMIVVSAGFILSLIALAFGWTAFATLNIILFSFSAGDLIGNLTKLVLYRRGA